MKENKTLAYHFTDGMKLRDGQEFIEGETYVHEGPIEICRSGLHASRRVIDALQYAPSGTLSVVECSGIVEEHDDKFVCRERKVIETHDVTRILQDFALDVAEEAVRKYCKIEEDTRPFDAIRITRLYVDGKATFEELAGLEKARVDYFHAAFLSDVSKASYVRSDAYDDYITRSAYNAAYYASKHATATPAYFFADEAVYFAYHAVACASAASEVFHEHIISEYNSQLTERLQKVFKTSLDF